MERGFVVWVTGLPGAGKTAIARCLEKALGERGVKAEVLDGNEVRRELSPELGFSKKDREIHATRVAYIAKLLARNGVAVVVALISPYRSFRDHARREIGDFVEVYVKCSLETCMRRDTKGLYERAIRGEITNLTGLQDPYEEPLNPEVVVDAEVESPEGGADKIIRRLIELGYLSSGLARA